MGLLFESAPSQYIRLMRSAPAVNQTRPVVPIDHVADNKGHNKDLQRLTTTWFQTRQVVFFRNTSKVKSQA